MIEVILGLACLAVMGAGVFGLVMAGAIGSGTSKARAEGEAMAQNKDAVLDAVFDGRPVVAYESTIRTLSVPAVTEGAIARGYELISNTEMAHGELVEGRDLLFKKRDQAPQ